jgi:hypothetical protein
MTRVLNAIPRENAADYRRVLNRQELPKLKPAPGTMGKPKALVPQLRRIYQQYTHIVQLPLYLKQPHAGYIAKDMLAERRRLAVQKREYDFNRDNVARILAAYYPHGMPGLASIDYVRLSPRAGNPKTEMDDDNLGACCKPIRDALSSVSRYGREWAEHMDIIGQADGWLKQQGVTWLYRQAKYEANPRMFGIQIWLRFTPQSEQP